MTLQAMELANSPAINSLAGGLGALVGTLASWVSLRPRVKRLEQRVMVVLRLLLAQTQASGLSPEQKALVETLLSEAPGV